MNFAVAEGNPDEEVRKHVLELRKLERQENQCRVRAEAAARCGKPHTAKNAMDRANEYAAMRTALYWGAR